MTRIHKSKSMFVKKGKQTLYDSDTKNDDSKRTRDLDSSVVVLAQAPTQQGPAQVTLQSPTPGKQGPAGTASKGPEQATSQGPAQGVSQSPAQAAAPGQQSQAQGSSPTKPKVVLITPGQQGSTQETTQVTGLDLVKLQVIEDSNRDKDKKINDLENQLRNMEFRVTETKTQLKISNEQRENAVKAMKKTIADKRKVEDDYKEVAQKLGAATRNIVELEEELKVTNDICEALEIDHEEKEGLELARKKEQEKYVVSIENDDEDLVEDESTGELHPTKVAKILEVHQTPASEANNACKKCDKIISNK